MQKQDIKELIYNALITLGVEADKDSIVVDVPKDLSKGDFATNTAMKFARNYGSNPREFATKLVECFKDEKELEKVEIAGPGFINFFVSKDLLKDVINEINDKLQSYSNNDLGTGIKINVEYVSVNPTGDIHIGHARGAAVGSAITNILDKCGYDVTREYYLNDAGKQIDNLALSIEARYKQEFGLDVSMPEDGYHGKEIIELSKKLKDEIGDKYLQEDGFEFFREYGLNNLLDGIKKDLKDFGVEFDLFFSERSLYASNAVEETVQLLIDNNYTYVKDDALWLRTSDFNDEKDRVIRKSDGLYTYLTPDIAYHKNKLDRGFDKLVDILGGDHHGYIDRLKASIDMVGHDSKKLDVELLQMVKVLQNGEEVKMSKRSGKAITLRDMIDEVGVDPIRYFFNMRSLNTQMDLDLDLALRQSNENPVFYVQYAHARICSILRLAEENKLDYSNVSTYEHITEEQSMALISALIEYPNVVKSAALSYSPHKITNYLKELASLFHSFYNNVKVLTEDKEASKQRLKLLNAVKIVISDALSLIGVSAPEKM